MKLLYFSFLLISSSAIGQNQLAIPATIETTNINLTLQEGVTQFYPGVNTNTMGANGALLGPTLIMSQGDNVNITVDNQLSDTTTIHWHGMHVAPENDGGPHSIILPGTTWNPQFSVMDKAGLYWYHPHLHMQTDKHVSKGIAGLIIVRDAEEAGFNLPSTYGIDEFPIVMQTKGFDAAGQILVHTELDTSVMVNGTVDAFTDFPAQVVRLRVLNGSSQRVMEFGFSDNRSFSLIGTDGGLFAAPLSATRYRIAPGQRVDILVDLTTSLGQNFQLMNFASELPNGIYGATQPGMGPGATGSLVGYTSNPLNGNDYQMLDITVTAQTASPILTIPASLANVTPLLEASASITRNLTFTSAGAMNDLAGPFLINGSTFDMGTINYTVPLDNIEIWSLTNETPISHPFHIHDVQFFILDINGTPPPPELQGLNDVVLVPSGMGNVRFIAQFSDFANDSIPFMYHCHMLTHEDMGMMGQFLVTDPNASVTENSLNEFNVYPNPSIDNVTIEFKQSGEHEIIVHDVQGREIKKELTSLDQHELNLSNFDNGVYIIIVNTNGVYTSKRIIKQ
ncbi:MAG: multicopper oxidase domain-containing protein [Flavobacteriales bacterium]|jgi:FtsP/CotA-like multicopper oxidase with cupredoxin domain|nr:multicopper oxidase domain-containing protein [Flavobacteriales bacterium]